MMKRMNIFLAFWASLQIAHCDLEVNILPVPKSYEKLTCKTLEGIGDYKLVDFATTGLDEDEYQSRLSGVHYRNADSGSETIFLPLTNAGKVLRIKAFLENDEIEVSVKAYYRDASNAFDLADWDAAATGGFAPLKVEFNSELQFLYILESDRFLAVTDGGSPTLEFSATADSSYEYIDFQYIYGGDDDKLILVSRHTSTGALRLHEINVADGSAIDQNDASLDATNPDTERDFDYYATAFPYKDGYVSVAHFLPLIPDEDFFLFEYSAADMYSATSQQRQESFRLGQFLAEFNFLRYHPDYLVMAGRQWNYLAHFYLMDLDTGVTRELDSLHHDQLIRYSLPVDCPPPNRDFSFFFDDYDPKTSSITVYRSGTVKTLNGPELNLYLILTDSDMAVALVNEKENALGEQE